MTKTVTIFGSSRVSKDSNDYQNAYELGKLLGKAGFTICNGGYGGIMEATARGAKSAGGRTIGIITEIFSRFPNRYIDQTILEKTLLSRLEKLVEIGDAYIVLKGATGTLAELAIVWEYINKGIMTEKPIIVLGNFWLPVIKTLNDELTWEGLENCTKFVTVVTSPNACVEILKKKFF
ncbi:MAG: LOG family protein [Bacteroidetes bacterium]|nr:LOG family protein [Bacteroidota bacterium]MBU1423931.1 LOG family protein [Bacteroidota bacterium]MBU2635510.1 LOG family protein [Bacteroidota bacterium]